MLKIANIRVDPPLALAPMSGITDSAFRRAIKELGGCGLLFTELISSEALCRKHPKTLEMLRFVPEERPLGIQIFGSDPERMALAARLAEDQGADFIDINIGCPARKVVQTGAGAHLLRDTVTMRRILDRVFLAIQIPMTVKIRSGWDPSTINALHTAQTAEESGAAAVTLHARTRSCGYTGKADWNRIAELCGSLRIPVIGNGDVRRPEDVQRMFQETGCQGVMIGRGVLTNPWLFRQSRLCLEGKRYEVPTSRERWEVFLRFMELAEKTHSDRLLLDRLKKFSCYFTREMPGSSHLRDIIQRSTQLDPLLKSVEHFLLSSGGRSEGDKV
jgi:tRNA-dihydrouridine synthase B